MEFELWLLSLQVLQEDWTCFLSQFKNEVVSRKVLERVVDVALELTYRGYGGLFFVGRQNDDLKTDPPRFPINPGKNIIGLDKETLVDLAKQDGATIVDEFGNLAAAGVTLRPADAKIPKEYRGRTRHAAAYLASFQSKGRYVVVVSQNRTLCVFEDGRKYVL